VQKWGDEMPNTKKNGRERLNLTLDSDQAKKLNDYCLAVANKQGRMPHAIKTKIGRAALDEWLEKHGKDLTIKFE